MGNNDETIEFEAKLQVTGAINVNSKFGQELYERYIKETEERFDNNPWLKIRVSKNGDLVGFNSYSTVLLEDIIPREYSLIETKDTTIGKSKTLLKGSNLDLGFVVFSIEEPNIYIAYDILEQIQGLSLQFPLFIPNKALKLAKTDDYNQYPAGLSFEVVNKRLITSEPGLIEKGPLEDVFFSDSDINTETGLPNRLYSHENIKGSNLFEYFRVFHRGKTGLTRFYQDIFRDLHSDESNLSLSSGSSRLFLKYL